MCIEMENVLIHIGFHKTGTTWFHKEFFGSRNETFISLTNNQSGKAHLRRNSYMTVMLSFKLF